MQDIPLSEFILQSIEDCKTVLKDTKYKFDVHDYLFPLNENNDLCELRNATTCEVCFGGAFLIRLAKGHERSLRYFDRWTQELASALDNVRTGFLEAAVYRYYRSKKFNDRRHFVEITSRWVKKYGMDDFYAEMEKRALYLKEQGF